MKITLQKHFAVNHLHRIARSLIWFTNNCFEGDYRGNDVYIYPSKAFKKGLKITKKYPSIHQSQYKVLQEEIETIIKEHTEKLVEWDEYLSECIGATQWYVSKNGSESSVDIVFKTWYKINPSNPSCEWVETYVRIGKGIWVNEDGSTNTKLVNKRFPQVSHEKLMKADRRLEALNLAVKQIQGEISNMKEDIGRVYFDR